MGVRLFVVSATLVLAAVAGQNSLQHSTANGSESTMTCSTSNTTGLQESCMPSPLGAASGSVLGHEVLAGGCAGGDLHVMRFPPQTAESGPLVAAWCG